MYIMRAWNIANSILIKSFNDKIYITPLKLNCLIYLLYGEYLYLTGEVLFNDLMMKSDKGPLAFSIYEKFGSYRNNAIKSYARDAKDKVIYAKSEKIDECLNYIWEKYKNKTEDEILSYIDSEYRYHNKHKGEAIEPRDILIDTIRIKVKELGKAKVYSKTLKLSNNSKSNSLGGEFKL